MADLPGLGPTLLPASRASALRGPDSRTWRLNPSYSLRTAAARIRENRPPGAVEGRRHQLPARCSKAPHPRVLLPTGGLPGARRRNARRLLWLTARKGDIGSLRRHPHLPLGRHDAAQRRPRARAAPPPWAVWLLRCAPPAVPPEKVQTVTGRRTARAPRAFPPLCCPTWHAGRTKPPLKAQQEPRTHPTAGGTARRPATLLRPGPGPLGTGWMDQRYQFLPSGRLQLRWERHVRKEAPPPKHPDSGLVASWGPGRPGPGPGTPPPRH